MINTKIETGLPAYPYPGLRPCGRKESAVFFGRDEQIDQLLAMLENNRFLAVVGPSGCGKSSLVRAGIIPALEAGFMASAGFRWDVAVMRPGNRPIHSLSRSLLVSSVFGTESPVDQAGEAFLAATLRRGPLGLIEALRDAPAARGQNLLLVVDQFEEIFRFEKKGDSNEARAFVDLLLASSESPDVSVYVITTMRSDFLGNCPVFSGLPEAMNNSQFLTPRQTRDQKRLAIECPSRLFNATVDEGVVSRILNEMGNDPDQLPLMQHLLMRMWRHANKRGQANLDTDSVALTLADYHNAGGLKGALSSHAQATYEHLGSDKRKHIAETLFRRLTEVTPKGQAIRRFAFISDVANAADADVNEVKSVVQEFRKEGRSFLMPSEPEELTLETPIDISHESLIRQWRQLSDWTEDEAKARRVEHTLKAWAARWRDEGLGEDIGVEQKFVLTGVDLEEALEWGKSHLRVINQPEWKLENDFLSRSEFFRDEAVRQEEAVKHAEELALKAVELEGKNNQLEEAAVELAANANDLKDKSDQLEQTAQREKLISKYLRWALYGLMVAVVVVVVSLLTARSELASAKTERAQAEIELASATSEREQAEIEREQAVEERSKAETKFLLAEDAEATARTLAILTAAKTTTIDPELQTLLGLEAYRVISQSPQSNEASKQIQETENRIGNFIDLAHRKMNPSGIVQKALSPHSQRVKAVAIDATGKWLVTASLDKTARLWDLENPEKAKILRGHSETIYDVAFSPNGNFVTVSGDGTARYWNPDLVIKDEHPTPTEIFSNHQPIADRIYNVAITKRWLLFGTDKGTAYLSDFDSLEASQKEPKPVSQHKDPIEACDISSDNQWLATGASDGFVHLIDLTAENGQSSIEKLPHDGKITVTQFYIDEPTHRRYLITGSREGDVKIWDLNSQYREENQDPKSRIQIRSITIKLPVVKTAALSPDGKQLAIVSDENVYLCDLNVLNFSNTNSTTKPYVIFRHFAEATQVAFSPDSTWLVCGWNDPDSTIRLWRIPGSDGQEIAESVELPGHKKGISCLAFRRPTNGKSERPVKYLVTADNAGKAIYWDLSTENSLIRVPREQFKHAATFSTKADKFAAVGADGTIKLWDIKANTKNLHCVQVQGHQDPAIRSIVLSDDSRWIATGNDFGEVLVTDLQNKASDPISLNHHSQKVGAIRFSKESASRLITGSHDRDAVVWDFVDNKREWTLKGHTNKVNDVALSANDVWAATACVDRDVPALLWKLDPDTSLPDSVELPGLKQSGEGIRQVEFGHAGQFQSNTLLATGGHHIGSIRIFEIDKNGKISMPRPALTPPVDAKVTGLAFSNNNRWLAAGNSNGDVYLVDVAHQKSAPIICTGHGSSEVTFVGFSPDNHYLATGDKNGRLWLWDVKALEESAYRESEIEPVNMISEIDDEIIVAKFRKTRNDWDLLFAGADGTVRSENAKPRRALVEIVETVSDIINRNLSYQEWARYEEYIDPDSEGYHKTINQRPTHPTLFEAPKQLAQSGMLTEAITKLIPLLVVDGQDDAEKRAKEIAYAEYGRELAKMAKLQAARKAFAKAGDLTIEREKEVNRLAAPAVLEQGRAFALAGKLSEARSKMEEANSLDTSLELNVDYELAKLLRVRGLRLAQDGNESEARTTLEKAKELYPGLKLEPEREIMDVLRDQAAAYVVQARGDEAIAIFAKIEEVAGFDRKREAERILNIARGEAWYRKPNELAEILRVAKNLDPTLKFNDSEDSDNYAKTLCAESLIGEAKRLAARGMTSEAAAKLSESKKLKPDWGLKLEKFENEFRALGLMNEAREFALKGKVDEAKAKFEEANSLNAKFDLDPTISAKLLASRHLIDEGKRIAEQGDVNRATEKLEQAKQYDPSLTFDPKTYVSRIADAGRIVDADSLIRSLAEEGQVTEALKLYNHTREFDPSIRISVRTLNQLAWYACLSGYATEVKSVAENIVVLDSDNGNYRDTRGLIRALTGSDVDNVVRDFEFYMASPESLPELREKRKGWVKKLRDDVEVSEVFSDDVLEELRKTETNSEFLNHWNSMRNSEQN